MKKILALITFAFLAIVVTQARDFNATEEIRLLPASGQGVHIGTNLNQFRDIGGVLHFSNNGADFFPLVDDTLDVPSAEIHDLTVTGRLAVNTTADASRPFPIMTEAQRDILTAVDGDFIFNQDSGQVNQYYNAEWTPVSGIGGLSQWEIGGEYTANVSVVWESTTLDIYVANATHIGGATFAGDIANWTKLSDVDISGLLEKFPSEVNDNRLVRTDVDGNAIQGSVGVLSDAGALSGLTSLDFANLTLDDAGLSKAGSNITINAPTGVQINDLVVGGTSIVTSFSGADMTLSPSGVGRLKFTRGDLGINFEAGSINPELGELMKYPSFEESTAEVTVTNATAALVANDLHGTQALQCTGTGASARCCVVVDVPAQREGIRHEVSCNLKTADTGVEFTLINNGVDRGFYEVTSNNEWTAYSFLADATDSIGFCIDQADTDVTLVDNCSITSSLSKRAAVDCANEFDCVNEFSAKVSATGVVSGENLDWISGDAVISATSNFTLSFTTGMFAGVPNCTATIAEATVGTSDKTAVILSASTASVVVQTKQVGTGANAYAFNLDCSRSTDYKTIPERGVINVNMDAQGFTKPDAYTPSFQGFGTPTNVQAYWSRSATHIDLNFRFTGGTSTAVEARVGLPEGVMVGDLSSLSIVGHCGYSVVSVFPTHVLAQEGEAFVTFGVQDSSRAALTKLNGSTFLSSGTTVSCFARIPIQGWTARQEIVADLGFENIYQREETINATGSGDFTGGSLKVSRVGNVVTLTTNTGIPFASSVTGASATGFLPSWSRPQTLESNLYSYQTGSRQRYIEVNPNGTVSFAFSDGTSLDNSGITASITYSVADSISSPAMIRSCIGTECENVFSARINNDGTATIANQSLDFIESVNRTGTGVVVVTWKAGIFTVPPVVVANAMLGSSVTTYTDIAPGVSTTGVTIRTGNDGFAGLGDAPFNLIVTKQGSDYKRSRTIVETTLEVPAIPYVSGGAELETGNTWDGEPIYRRCYEIASDITTSTTIATIQTGLKSIQTIEYFTDFVNILSHDGGGSSASRVQIFYRPSTGAIIAVGEGTYVVKVGTKFCMEYLK